MNRQILDSLIQDESIRSLLEKSADAYWLSEIYDYNLGISNNEQEILVRLAVLYSTLSLSEESKNTKNLEYAYKLLLAIKIEDSNYLSLFEKIAGIDEVDNTLLYYFLLSSIALKDDNTISARINLKQFYSDNIIITEDWKGRVLSKILYALILLIRKDNGFVDVKQALQTITELQSEQEKFEENYLQNFQYKEEVKEALSLLALYHTSKAVVETAHYLIDGYSYPKRIENVIRVHIDMADKLLGNTQNRLKDIIKIISNDLKSICQNSIWSHTAFQDKIRLLCEKKSQSGILELLPSQRNALAQKMLDVYANATIPQMPTSAGKTLLAEFNIIVTKSLRSDAKIIYVVPSRALVNQVYYDLKSDLSDLGICVEKTSSAIEIDPTENEFLTCDKIDILVSTPEKLDLLIRRKHPSVNDISLFIIDEAHTIGNGQRGARLELLMAILKRERPNAKFMLLSPFLHGKKDVMAEWLGGGNTIQIDWKPAEKLLIGLKNHKTKHIDEIKYELLASAYDTSLKSETKGAFNNPYKLQSSSEKDRILEFASKHFAETGKTQLILCYGRGTANKRAGFIYNLMNSFAETEEIALVRKYIDDEIGKETTLTKYLSKGIAIHHAGLSDEAKLLIEYLIREKQIKYVCATTTIAEGVNFPVSSVFFDDYRKGDTVLSSNDFWNIAGRAGRTLVDNFGKIIMPFHTSKSEDVFKGIIQRSSDELASVLAELFINENSVRSYLSKKNGIYDLVREYSSFSPLFQYFVHLLTTGQNTYAMEVEDLFKDSLQYYLLETEEQKERFVQLCKSIYQSIELKYSGTLGALQFADKTGFSVPSVLKIIREKSQNDIIANLAGWQPNVMFNKRDNSNLTEKIKVIATLKETNLGTDSKEAPFSPELIAKMVTAWVKGDKLNSISLIHPSYKTLKDDERMTEFMKKMNDIRFKTSWGLSALEGIVKGNQDEIQDSYIPSLVYYGVDSEKPLALRMLGIPRSLSFSLANIIDGDLKNFSYSSLRKKIKGLSASDWDNFKPKKSNLTGDEWRRIVEILMK